MILFDAFSNSISIHPLNYISDLVVLIFNYRNEAIHPLNYISDLVVLIFNYRNEAITKEVLCCSWVGWPKGRSSRDF
jgi:hypothetical protein